MGSDKFVLISTDRVQSNGPQFIVDGIGTLVIRWTQSLNEFDEPRLVVRMALAVGKYYGRSEQQESANQKYLDAEQHPQKQAFVQLVAN